MTMQARQNQLKQAEIQGNKAKIVQGKTESRKMTMQSKKQIQNQAQAGYMQNNEPKTVCGEAGKQNRIKTHSQSGRSMIEMLGVLAIIAILSIGGIVGYRLAMNYYQANQIAHELNMMRTDAQIKIAQGTENLTLGSPYDAHKINFNNYDTAFGCKYVDENDLISDETVSCRIANAYFVELPKIPNGVCQPLARLINGMDNLIAFSVNDSEYEEGGNCQEGENDLYAVFSGETISDLTHCERDDDCKELESTPVCDLSRHVCVECTEEKGCEGDEHCENNTCVTCASGVWNGTDCVECTEDNDCLKKGTEKPVCNENKCEPCPDGQQWKESAQGCAAYECRTNEDCTDGKYCYFKTDGKNGECNLESGKTEGCYGEWKDETQGGTCKDVNSAFRSIKATIKSQEYVVSNESMTWWSACRLCAANAGRDDSDCVYPTTATPDFMLDASILECNPAVNINSKQHGCCYLNGTDISIGSNASKEDLSDSINELRKTKGCDPNIKGYQGGNLMCPYHFWASNSFSNEFVYGIDMDSGYIAHNARNDGDYAFDFGGYAVCRQ